jgi:murein L,D-transpeptidase YafK
VPHGATPWAEGGQDLPLDPSVHFLESSHSGTLLRRCTAASSFHRALHISYPGPADIAAARAHDVNPGSLVMVHGLRNGLGWLGRLHLAVDWTDGCVAVTDRDMDEIWRAVPDGTKIVLKP